MSATITSTSKAVSEWVEVFPRQVTESYTSSVTFIKKLTLVGISTVAYLNNTFPEDSYMTECLAGIKMKILKSKCRHDTAQFLSTAITKAFDAIEKKYLHQLALCFYEDECKIENLIGYYLFEYSYSDAGVTMNVRSMTRDSEGHSARFSFERVRQQTIHLIQTCMVMTNMCQSQLPDDIEISLRLYYNDEAPADYQAPGFTRGDEDLDHLADQHLQQPSVGLARVQTPYHSLRFSSYVKSYDEASHEAVASQNAPVITQSEITDEMPATNGVAPELRCPCLRELTYGLPPSALLTCRYCGTRQHAACFGVLPEHAARFGALPERAGHCCAECYDADPARRPTDTRLVPLLAKTRECVCIFRCTLEWCRRLSAVGVRGVAARFELSDLTAARLVKNLEWRNIVQETAEFDMPHEINQEALQSAIRSYFQTPEDRDIVDQVIEHALGSQGSQADQISEMLTPLQKINLQNSSNMYKVVENPDLSETLDPSLSEYRDAILSNDKVEVLEDEPESPVKRKTVKRKAEVKKTQKKYGLRTGFKTTKRVKFAQNDNEYRHF